MAEEEQQQRCRHLDTIQCTTRSALLAFLEQIREDASDGRFVCYDCDLKIDDHQSFVCLNCSDSVIRCGRYHQQHALAHSNGLAHSLCVNVKSTAVWCYFCDKEVFLPYAVRDNIEDQDNPAAFTAIPTSDQEPFPNPIAKFKETKGYLGDGSWRLTRIPSGGMAGLANLGNTCFLNSGLQAILHIPQAIEIFGQRNFVEEYLLHGSRPHHLLFTFSELVHKIWSGKYEVCAPRDLVRNMWQINPIFRGYEQQDTQEFLRCLMSSLHEALKHWVPVKLIDSSSGEAQVRAIEKSLVNDLFQGLLLSQVTCESCHNVSEVYDPFMDLSLEIPNRQQLKRITDQSALDSRLGFGSGMLNSLLAFGWGAPTLSLETCLQSFCSTESLIRLDQYNCEKCKNKVNASKVLSIGKCPEVLTLHIKRFSHNSYWGSKLSTPIEFPLEGLDLSPFIRKMPPVDVITGKLSNCGDDSCLYNLTSFVKHMGSVSAGHYVAYAKHHISGVWYEFNDRAATEVSEDVVKSQEAYILVYTKITSKAFSRPFDNFFKDTLSLTDALPEVYISLYWLKRAEIFSHPGPIDNYSLCCKHGRPLNDDRINKKSLRISASAYKILSEKFGGGPMIEVTCNVGEGNILCPHCLDIQRKAENRRILYLENDHTSSRDLYLISLSWLTSWRGFIAGGPIPSAVDNTPLLEADGKTPKPGLAVNKDYRAISTQVWSEFIRLYGGGPAIIRPSDNIYDSFAIQINNSIPEQQIRAESPSGSSSNGPDRNGISNDSSEK